VRALTVGVWAATALVAAPSAWGLGAGKGLDRYAVERWRVSDGLPGDSVQALAQAADGQLWIATLGGLARYDGIRFSRVQGPRDGRGVAIDVRRLLAAWDGSVWAGSPYFTPVRFVADQPAAIDATAWGKRAGVLAWAEDEGGTLWMADGRGLVRFGEGRLTAQAMPGLEGRPTEMHLHTGGTLWVGTDQGLFSMVQDHLVRFAPLSGPVSALHEDRRGVLWVAAGERLWAIEGGRGRSLGSAQGLPRGPISSLADDEEGSLWFGSPTGLGRLRGDRVEVFRAADGLPEDDVTALLFDREGSLWVGTRNGGLAQFSGRTLDTREGPPEVDGIEVQAVCEDAEGGWWYGTQKRGAVRWLNGRSTSFTRAQGLPSDFVPTLCPGDGGEVWIGTTEGLRVWRKGAIVDPGLWKGWVSALYRDRHGSLWIGGNGELGHLEGGKLSVLTAADGLPARQLRAIAEDGTGTLWVSGLGGPVVRWENGRFVRPANLRGFRTSPVRSMLTDRSGAFWLSVDRSGLLRVGRDGVRLFDGRQGLEAEILYQLLEDDDGDLWLGTNKSVLRLSRPGIEAVREGRRTNLEVVSFETTDRRAGVVASAIRQPSAWKGRDGRLRFATQRGVVEIDPRQVRTNLARPPVQIEAVIADGRAQPTSGEARLPRTGRLEIHYAAHALLEPSKVRYRYRLEGVDPGWVEAGPARVAAYASLPAGTFRFRLQASNNDSLWNEEGASLLLVVAAPLYRRPWFYGLCALGLVPIAFGLYRMRVARLHAHYVGMFTERTRMARELHDTLLQGMSGIAMQLGSIRARLDGAPEGPRRDLERLQDTVTRCLEEARRAVWDLRDQGRRDSALGPALARFARRLFRPVRTAYDLKIQGPPRHLPNAVEDELFRIAQEALRNAVAHAQATLVRIQVCYDVDTVTLTVSDDGVGFDPGNSHPEGRGHFGLAGLHERAAKISARLDIRSAPGTGTTIEVVAPAPGSRS
jgi:signal transduction histidine kinase/ligand-binding sensor domain-containing protein